MMEGDENMELLECQLGEEEGDEEEESPRSLDKAETKSQQGGERF